MTEESPIKKLSKEARAFGQAFFDGFWGDDPPNNGWTLETIHAMMLEAWKRKLEDRS